jgi:hypothetical protein
MYKETEYDLRQCERGLEPQHKMTRDLAQNREFADNAVAIADRFFNFDFSQVYFSSFARDQDWGEEVDYGPLFRVEVWNKAELYCCVGFQNVGILGTLHVDLMDRRDPNLALGQDYIGAVRQSLNQVRNLPETFKARFSAKVNEDMLYLEVDMRP